ncbi:hypothetical protein D3C81_1144300 [compost metagenome]
MGMQQTTKITAQSQEIRKLQGQLKHAFVTKADQQREVNLLTRQNDSLTKELAVKTATEGHLLDEITRLRAIRLQLERKNETLSTALYTIATWGLPKSRWVRLFRLKDAFLTLRGRARAALREVGELGYNENLF